MRLSPSTRFGTRATFSIRLALTRACLTRGLSIWCGTGRSAEYTISVKGEGNLTNGEYSKNGENVWMRFTVGEISIKVRIVLLSENRGLSVTVT